MNFTKFSLVITGTAAIILLSGCVSSEFSEGSMSTQGGDFIYRGHDFGANRNTEYQLGVKDGCKTSDGDYTKNHGLFNENESYHNGWEHGRLHCKSQKAT